MIVSKNFVIAYNKLFKKVHERDGKEAVIKLWEAMSDAWLDELKELAIDGGLAGCYRYWQETLGAEGAVYEIELLDNRLTIKIKECPSLSVLKEPYENYCEHCNILYRRALEPLGFKYAINYNKRGQCEITVSR